MKHILRVPTPEPYAYLEAEYEGDSEGAVEKYRELTDLVRGNTRLGVKDREFEDILDEYLSEGKLPGGKDVYNQLNQKQTDILKAVEKSLKRIKQ